MALRRAGATAIQGRRALALRPLAAVLLAAHAVLLVVLGLRAAGALQALELLAYDAYLDWHVGQQPPIAEILIVGITDDDVAGGDTTVSDGVLASALAQLLAYGPAAVGLDLLRAAPIPPGSRALERVLREHPEVVVVAGFADRHEPARASSAAPPAVTDPARIGFADVDLDPDGLLRRGLLYLSRGEGPETSLALRLAQRYLARAGIHPEPDGPDLRLGMTSYVPLHTDAGGYAGLPGGGYQLLLTYPGCARGLATVSIGDVVRGALDPADIVGRVVLVGNRSTDAKDVLKIPVECAGAIERELYGVAVHGQIAAQLIRQARGEDGPLETPGQVLRDPALGQAAEILWIWLWTAVGGVGGLWLRRPAAVVLGAAAGVGVLLGSTLLAFLAAGWWLPVVPPLLGGLVALALAVGYLLAREMLKRTRLMRLFSAYLSPSVAASVWREDDDREVELPPVELTATVLFSDVRGFTTISELLPEKALMAWINEYMAVMADLVLAHGGAIEKFAGDGITAEFGVPEPRTSEAEIAADARAAVDCALAMAAGLNSLNRGWGERGLPEVGIRVGIHTGPLIVGNLGSARRKQYSIIGDTANTASRLESYGKDDPRLGGDADHCRILISGATLARLDQIYEVEAVGTLALKGKARPVEVYRVLGRRPRASERRLP